MGRSVSSPDAGGRRRGGALARLALGLALILVAGSALRPVGGDPGRGGAQSRQARPRSQRTRSTTRTITPSPPSAAVELYYKHRVLQADRVVYNRTTKRLYAEGHAKLTDEKGNVTYAKRFDLTDDFAAGFAEGVQSVSTDRTRFTSPRVERSAGAVTVFNSGVYTACEPCKAHPERPPLWQIRADEDHREPADARRLLRGRVARSRRRAGRLYPLFLRARSDGDPPERPARAHLHPAAATSASASAVPYFLDLAPNYDLTLTPTYFSSQGPFLDAEWRQRLENGQYSVRVTGIYQQNPSLFPAYPYDAGDRRYRGSLGIEGRVLSQRQVALGLGHHRDVRPVLSQRLQDQGRRPVAATICRTSSRRSICAARPTAASSISAAIGSRARRPPPTSASSRSPRCSTTTRRLRSRPRRPAGSAARSRSTSTRSTSRARRRPTSRRWPTLSTRPITSTMSAGRAARSSAVTSSRNVRHYRGLLFAG